MKILTNEMRSCRRGPEEWFTGTVWLDEIVIAAPARMKAFRVSFEPGARTAWHTHPLGQALHVLTGMGLVQLQGQPAQAIRPGDTVWIEPGEVHWHGAAPGHTMVASGHAGGRCRRRGRGLARARQRPGVCGCHAAIAAAGFVGGRS